ncbi:MULTISPECIES: hypothetical protein [unclassified Streptomyces]|uniref:hypothetical protein n=1 Tax=unclassified Streptomyces TaxID=2593676 RepID=UPI003818B9C9
MDFRITPDEARRPSRGSNRSAPPGFFDVNDDVDQIAVILQQEACAERAARRSHHKTVVSARKPG